jgi:hypothetical protein
MDRTGDRIAGHEPPASRAARSLRAALLLLIGALALAGCYVVPAQPVYVAPGPVIVAPAPVYRWHRHGWYGHRWHGHARHWR